MPFHGCAHSLSVSKLQIPEVVPSDPASVTVTINDIDSITINWSNVPRESGYHVYSNGELIGTVTNDVLTFDYDIEFVQGEEYDIEVAAFNTGGESDRVAADLVIPYPDPPAAPASVTPTIVDVDEVSVDWADSAGAVEYEVYCDGSLLDTVADGPYTDTAEFVEGQAYTYSVKAKNTGGTSSATAADPVTPNPITELDIQDFHDLVRAFGDSLTIAPRYVTRDGNNVPEFSPSGTARIAQFSGGVSDTEMSSNNDQQGILDTAIPSCAAFYVAMVVKLNTVGAQSILIAHGDYSVLLSFYMQYSDGAGAHQAYVNKAGSYTYVNQALNNTSYHLLEYVYDGSNLYGYLDGTAFSTTGGALSPMYWDNTKRLTFLAFKNGGSYVRARATAELFCFAPGSAVDLAAFRTNQVATGNTRTALKKAFAVLP